MAESSIRFHQLRDLIERLTRKHKDEDVPATIEEAARVALLFLGDAVDHEEAVAAEEADKEKMRAATLATSANANATDIFSLPVELRDWIYEFCVESPGEELHVGWRNRKGFHPLTQVNRQLRAEVLPRQIQSKTLELCFCMLADDRMEVFLQGPDVAIIPQIRRFFLQGKSSRLSCHLFELCRMKREGFVWLKEYGDGDDRNPNLEKTEGLEYDLEGMVLKSGAESNAAAAKMAWVRDDDDCEDDDDDDDDDESEDEYLLEEDDAIPSIFAEDFGKIFTRFRQRAQREGMKCNCGGQES